MGPNALRFFHSLARKGLTKNRGSGITEIADRMVVESEAASMIQTLVDSGLPLERFDQFIRSEADVLKFLNIVKNANKPRVIPGTSAEGKAITEKLFGKKGEVVEFPQPKTFKQEIDAMKKSGDIVDVDDIKISEKITDREMFKDSNLNKPTVEGQMDKINAASNRIKQIQKEQADMYKPKTDAELIAKYDKQNKESVERLKKKKRDSMPIRLIKNFDQELNEADLIAEGYSKDQANVLMQARKKMISGEEMSPNESLLRVKEDMADARGIDVEDFTDIDFEVDIPDYAKGGRAGFAGGLLAQLAKTQLGKRFMSPSTSGAIKLVKGFMNATGRKPNKDEILKIIREAAERDLDNAISSAKPPGLMSKDEFAMNVGGGSKAIGRRIKEIDQDALRKSIDEFNIPIRTQEPFDFATGGRARFQGGGSDASKAGFKSTNTNSPGHPSNQTTSPSTNKATLGGGGGGGGVGYNNPPPVVTTVPTGAGLDNLIEKELDEPFEFNNFSGKLMTKRDMLNRKNFIDYVDRFSYESGKNNYADNLYDMYEQASGTLHRPYLDTIVNSNSQSWMNAIDGKTKQIHADAGSITVPENPDLNVRSSMVSTDGETTQRQLRPSGIWEDDVFIGNTAPSSLGVSTQGDYVQNLNPLLSPDAFEDIKDHRVDVSVKDINRLIDPVSNKPKYSSSQDVDDIRMFENAAEFEFNPTMTDQEITDVLDKKITRPTGKFMTGAEGGRAGYYTGGITDVKPNLSDIGHGSDSLMSRTRLVSPGSQATTSTGLNYLLAEDNDNIRVPFKGGGLTPEDYLKVKDMLDHYHDYRKGGGTMPIKNFGIAFFRENNAEGGRIGFAGGGGGRRAFLKLLATLGGGAAAFKTGLLSLGGKGATKKAVTETVKQATGSGTPPPYFFKLVEKIKLLGDDTIATKDKAIAKKYKDYTLEEDFAGNIEIIKKNNNISEDVYMSYKVDEVPTKIGKKKSTKVEEYEEYTAKPDQDGKMRDIEQGVPDEVVNEGSVFDDDYVKFSTKEIEKADGGRIGFSAGGGKFLLSKLGINSTTTRFLEKVFGKQKFQNLIENDPEMHRGLLEVAEMFRSKDKSGLVEYMQNFLPQMSKKELEAFIVSSGDSAGIEGQLIRLGSGRDYRNKLDMIEEANNIRKLKDFDVEGVSKNAEGGRIEMKGGGSALKALINFFANKAGKKGSSYLRDINPKVIPEGIENIMGPGHLKALQKNQTDYVESLLQIIKSDKNFINNLKANADEAIAQAPIGMKDFAKEITESIKRDAMKGSRFERFKVYDKIDIDDAIVDVEQMIKNRRVKESDGRALNASGGLQNMLGE